MNIILDTILWIIFPWMNKQQTKTPKETMSKLCVICFFNSFSLSFTHHVKVGTRYFYFGHNTCSCYVICKTIFIKSGIKIIRKKLLYLTYHIIYIDIYPLILKQWTIEKCCVLIDSLCRCCLTSIVCLSPCNAHLYQCFRINYYSEFALSCNFETLCSA